MTHKNHDLQYPGSSPSQFCFLDQETERKNSKSDEEGPFKKSIRSNKSQLKDNF
jgi:hypothetical protein